MKKLEEYLEKKKIELEKIRKMAEQSLTNCEHQEGSLRVSFCHGSPQYYIRNDSKDTNGKYVKKKDVEMAQRIAQRDYDNSTIMCAEKWLKWIDKTIKTMPSKNIVDVTNAAKSRRELIKIYAMSDEEYAFQWQSESYTGKTIADDIPEIITERGERVRSKSEKIIADKLYSLGIPYKYEHPLKLSNNRIFYPDFTLLNMARRKEIILEHFGLMDDEDYCNNAINKINLYAKNGYILGDNLLTTFETGHNALDIKTLENMLLQHLK